jgi:hypothetical protein
MAHKVTTIKQVGDPKSLGNGEKRQYIQVRMEDKDDVQYMVTKYDYQSNANATERTAKEKEAADACIKKIIK